MTDHIDRLTACNRKLVEDLNHARKLIELAGRIAAMLAQTAADWGEAHEALAQWEEMRNG